MMRMTRRDRNWNHSKAKEWSSQLQIAKIYPTLFPRINLDVGQRSEREGTRSKIPRIRWNPYRLHCLPIQSFWLAYRLFFVLFWIGELFSLFPSSSQLPLNSKRVDFSTFTTSSVCNSHFHFQQSHTAATSGVSLSFTLFPQPWQHTPGQTAINFHFQQIQHHSINQNSPKPFNSPLTH